VHDLNHERILMTFSKTFAGVTVLAAGALAGAAVATGAGSATKGSTTTNATTTAASSGHTPETALTGDVATKAKAAAVAKVGGTADSATTENDSSNAAAAYEVHVTKADGTRVKVILDSSYAVLSVETGGHGGGHHGRGGGNGETPLTGDVATQAKAAAVAKVGGTADRASTETDSTNAAAAYEVHVTKADGSHVVVILDKNNNVLTVDTAPSGGRHDDGQHDGFRR
jgi:uncharacterized membrane protein YkoI